MINSILKCLLITAGIIFSKIDITYSQKKNDSTSWHKKFSPGLYNYNYLRDYEYFSPIMEGYTLCGSIAQPTIEYKFSNHVSFRGGVFMQQNFGDDSLRVRPTFTLQLKNKSTEFQFGNYRSDGYELIEPLYFTDNLITENIDNGFIMRQYFKHLTIIQWLDWERAIEKGSDFQEQVWGGATINYKPLNKFNKALQFPVQVYIQHIGGQINMPDTSFYVKTVLNASGGLKTESREKPGFLARVGGEVHYVFFNDFSPNPLSIYNTGSGIWLSTYLRLHLNKNNTNSLKFILSYWKGENFLSPKGNPLMQSVSSVYPESDYTESTRTLAILAVKYENTIDKKFKLEISVEPYYDFYTKLLEYGIHMQFNFPITLNK